MIKLWTTDRFQTTGTLPSDWLYATLAYPCAGATAKSSQDHSDFLYNLLCVSLSPVALYSTVRLHYSIQGDCGEDILYGACCFPCLIRQTLHEVRHRGPLPNGKYGAAADDWHFGLTQCECVEFTTALLLPCVVSNTIRKVLQPSSDTWFNLLCLVPCSMYGAVRHTYGIRSEFPSPVCEDVGLGLVCYPCALSRAAKEAPYQRTTGRVGSAIETAHRKAEEMRSTLQNAKKEALSRVQNNLPMS